MKRLLLVLVAICLAGAQSDCSSTDDAQSRRTEAMVAQADSAVGMPGIGNWNERRFAKQLLELRDQEVMTFSYIVDLNGGLHFLCNSIGYGLPYATQYTNPERYLGQGVTLPQPEPNGLFMPASADATWVACSDGKQLRPVFVEPLVLISPFALKSKDALQ